MTILAAGIWVYLVIIMMVIAIIILLRSFAPKPKLPYNRRGKLVTKTELRFYHALRHCVRNEYTIFAMIRIADLLNVSTGIKKRRGWFNRISSKHIDFVLCDPDTLDVMVAIELDDSSHDRPDRVARDEFVNTAFNDAGLPLLRIPVQTNYDVNELRDMIDSAL